MSIDKEKQIEEIAKVISKTWLVDLEGNTQDVREVLDKVDIKSIAREVYENNYRKLTEDTIVISKDEYKCLKFIEKSYDPFWFCTFGGCEGACKECKDTCEMSIFVKERKKTAEKILEYASSKIRYNCEQFNQSDLKIDEEKREIATWKIFEIGLKNFVKEQFNIEIKENKNGIQ